MTTGIFLHEDLTHVAGSQWRASADLITVHGVWWNASFIRPCHYNVGTDTITFTAACKAELNDGGDIGAGEVVSVVAFAKGFEWVTITPDGETRVHALRERAEADFLERLGAKLYGPLGEGLVLLAEPLEGRP